VLPSSPAKISSSPMSLPPGHTHIQETRTGTQIQKEESARTRLHERERERAGVREGERERPGMMVIISV